MAKPWARYEIGFIQHRKFRRLHANSICLWLEGKDYADTNLTDGLLPDDVLRDFRFYSKKAVAQLTTSAGQKSEQETYAPLWESHPVGYKMHDYLAHNECREAVMDRFQDSEERKELRNVKNRDRQQRFRTERQDALRNASVTPSVTQSVTPETALRNALRNAPVTPVMRPPTDPDPDPDPKEERALPPRAHRGTVFAGGLPRDHRNHAECSPSQSHCVPMAVHEALANLLSPKFGGDRAAAANELKHWYARVWAGLPDGTVMGDAFAFWRSRFNAEYASPTPAASNDDAVWAAIAKKGPSVRG